jgi:hypothetical protein
MTDLALVFHPERSLSACNAHRRYDQNPKGSVTHKLKLTPNRAPGHWKYVHRLDRKYISNGINHLQRFASQRSSISTPRSVPFNRRTIYVPLVILSPAIFKMGPDLRIRKMGLDLRMTFQTALFGTFDKIRYSGKGRST